MAEVHILGSILGCSDFDEPKGLFCKFHLESGVVDQTEWQVLGGDKSGTTQVDCSGGEGLDAVWDHPIDVHFACPTLVGWPRLRVEVWSRDHFGSNILCGYGMANCPMQSGSHEIEIVTWVPVGGISERLSTFFLGIKPQLQDPTIVANTRPGEGRFGLKCESAGIVYISLEIMTAGLNKNGVKTMRVS
jgi:B9 domain-containing protein 2